MGHNGLDYEVLKNYNIDTTDLIKKTFDLMTLMIRTFGSYENMSLDNILRNTFNIKKKKNKKPNYKLIRNGQMTKVKENLKHELKMIEKLFKSVISGGLIRFKTPSGFVDEHEISEFGGFFPEYNEEIIEPYDFPFAGMRLQIKERYDFEETCKNCNKKWRIRSVSYYGDTMSQEVYCPNCSEFIAKTKSSTFGESTFVNEVLPKSTEDDKLNMEAKKLWETVSNDLPKHQIKQSQYLFKKYLSYAICWMCGETNEIRKVRVKVSENSVIDGLHCIDCIEIQKTVYATNYVNITQFKM